MNVVGGPAVAAGQQGGGAPVAGHPPQAPLGPLQPYQALYNNVAVCPFGNNYANIYAEWATPEGGNIPNTPGQLRNKLYSSAMGVQGVKLAHVLLVRPTNAGADNPGLIQGYHRLAQYHPLIGVTTSMDNVGYSFLGDVYEGNAPASVIFDEAYFNRVQTTRVMTAAAIDQHFAANPADELLGPFVAGDPDTEPIGTRVCMFIPNKYVTLVMNQGMSPKDAWLRIRATIVNAGEEAAMEPLINWFRVALTRPTAGALPRQAVEPPASQTFVGGLEAAKFNAFRQGLIQLDLPQLSNNALTAGANQIALGLNQLVTEQRDARAEDEARRRRDKHKTPVDLYGKGGILKLLRWCGVPSEADLPAVHLALANAGRGKSGGMTHRRALQIAVDTEAEALGFSDVDLQITSSVATRVVNLAWTSSTPDNLGVGLHPFAVGFMTREDTELQRTLNEEADLLYSGDTAPSLRDAQSIVSAEKDIHIPKTFAQGRETIKRTYLLLSVLLGNGHRVVEHMRRYLAMYNDRETSLETSKPRNPWHYSIVPALLMRRFQLELNEWMKTQAITPGLVPMLDITLVFQEIALQRDWAPEFPEKYLSAARSASSTDEGTVVSDVTTPTIATGTTGGTRASSSGRSTTTATTTPQGGGGQPQHNPAFNGATFESFRAKNLVTKRVKAYCLANSISLPLNRDNKVMCLAWHLKGHCSDGCGSKYDHRPHDAAEDQTLVAWAQANYRTS